MSRVADNRTKKSDVDHDPHFLAATLSVVCTMMDYEEQQVDQMDYEEEQNGEEIDMDDVPVTQEDAWAVVCEKIPFVLRHVSTSLLLSSCTAYTSPLTLYFCLRCATDQASILGLACAGSLLWTSRNCGIQSSKPSFPC